VADLVHPLLQTVAGVILEGPADPDALDHVVVPQRPEVVEDRGLREAGLVGRRRGGTFNPSRRCRRSLAIERWLDLAEDAREGNLITRPGLASPCASS
jgi:hypothetical protein